MNKFDWHTIAVHDENNVKGFFGDFRWCSNFHMCDVYFEGNLYPSSEHAYMASKLENPVDRKPFIKIPDSGNKHWGLSCSDARKLGQTVELRPDWDTVKYDYMLRIVFEKFAANPDLKELLLATGNKYLEETNSWRDSYWGVDYQFGGSNNLGKILTKIRTILQ